MFCSPLLKGFALLVRSLSVFWSVSSPGLFFFTKQPCSYRYLMNPVVFVCAVIPFFMHPTYVWGCEYGVFLRHFVPRTGEREVSFGSWSYRWHLHVGVSHWKVSLDTRQVLWESPFPNPLARVLWAWGLHGHLPPYKHGVGWTSGGTVPLSCGCRWGSSCPILEGTLWKTHSPDSSITLISLPHHSVIYVSLAEPKARYLPLLFHITQGSREICLWKGRG